MPDNDQHIFVRVYYEDTDFSGRVYHASYLRFFERGRTEWLRAFGFQHSVMARTSETAFAVTKLQVDFAAPAFIDDELEIVSSVAELRGPIVTFHQAACRDGLKLVTAAVDIVAIRGGRPVRPPRELLTTLSQIKRR